MLTIRRRLVFAFIGVSIVHLGGMFLTPSPAWAGCEGHANRPVHTPEMSRLYDLPLLAHITRVPREEGSFTGSHSGCFGVAYSQRQVPPKDTPIRTSTRAKIWVCLVPSRTRPQEVGVGALLSRTEAGVSLHVSSPLERPPRLS